MSVQHTIKRIIARHIQLPTPWDGAAAEKAAKEIEDLVEQLTKQQEERVKELEHQNQLLRQLLANSISDGNSQKLAS